MKKPKNVAEYIASFPKEAQKHLKEMRSIVKQNAKGAAEEIKWSMPAYTYNRIAVAYAGFKRHIGFYPTPGPLKHFAKELQKFSTSKGGVQFPLDKPLPKGIIAKMVKYRVKELTQKDAQWKPSKKKA